jgi:replicative DNA helicase
MDDNDDIGGFFSEHSSRQRRPQNEEGSASSADRYDRRQEPRATFQPPKASSNDSRPGFGSEPNEPTHTGFERRDPTRSDYPPTASRPPFEPPGGPSFDERAGGPSFDERAGGPSFDERAGGPSFDERAGGPSFDERAGGPSFGERTSGPSFEPPRRAPQQGAQRAPGPPGGSGQLNEDDRNWLGGMGAFLDEGFGPNVNPPQAMAPPPPRALGAAPSNIKPKRRNPEGLPHNIEAERSVLGAIFVRNEALDEIRETGLRKEDFYREAHGIIFQAACDLNERREPVDLVILKALLTDRGQLEAVGGTTFLTTLFEDGFAVGNAGSYAKVVREKAVLRRVIETCQDVVTDAMKGVENAEEFVDGVESRIFGVANSATTVAFERLGQVLMGNIQSIEELALKKSDVVGLRTGFNRFDYVTSGLQPGQVMILAARPGMGKTSWLLSAIQHAAVAEKKVCAVFSLEMGKEELGIRFLSGLSRIDSRSLKTGKLSDGDWKRLLEAADRLAKAKIFIDDSGALSAMDVRARCRRLKAQHKALDLIVVDYLQLMKGSSSKSSEGSREREIAEISRATKQLAKELKVPIIMLSQLNRGVEARQDKRPMLADLRESGSIEQDADIVCFIHRDDYYNKESEDKGIAELIVAKNRAGEQATCRMAWLGQYTLFANLAEDEDQEPINPARPEKGDVFL